MRHHTPAGLLVLAGASAAFGQAQGVGHWISEVSTQDGDSIVEPGETATVSLWMDMDPSVGDQLPDGSEVRAFGGGIFDILGGANAEDGRILAWNINDALDIGDDGFTDGVSIFDAEIFQLPNLDVDTSDPILLMSYEWQPFVYDDFSAMYTPFAEVPKISDGFYVYFVNDPAEIWPADEHVIQIDVVPSPAAPFAFCIASTPLLKRRRKASESSFGSRIPLVQARRTCRSAGDTRST